MKGNTASYKMLNELRRRYHRRQRKECTGVCITAAIPTTAAVEGVKHSYKVLKMVVIACVTTSALLYMCGVTNLIDVPSLVGVKDYIGDCTSYLTDKWTKILTTINAVLFLMYKSVSETYGSL